MGPFSYFFFHAFSGTASTVVFHCSQQPLLKRIYFLIFVHRNLSILEQLLTTVLGWHPFIYKVFIDTNQRLAKILHFSSSSSSVFFYILPHHPFRALSSITGSSFMKSCSLPTCCGLTYFGWCADRS